MHLIGLDVGTTGCKAIVFDVHGSPCGQAFREYGVICDAPAKAEQDAEIVWQLAKAAVREAVVQAGVSELRALSVSVQGDAIIPVDRAVSCSAPRHSGHGLPFRCPGQSVRGAIRGL